MARTLRSDAYPSLFLGALGNRLAQDKLFMPGFERGKSVRRPQISRGNVTVEILEQLYKRVGIAFRVSARICRIAARLWRLQAGILRQQFTSAMAPPDPERIW